MRPDENPRLSNADITYLLTVVLAVQVAPDEAAARMAKASAARAAGEYRARGIHWRDIAIVYRITEEELREWRALAERMPEPPQWSARGRRGPSVPSRSFCFLAGDTTRNGNHFDQEAGQVRDFVTAMALGFQYEPSVEIDQVTTILGRHKPMIAHIAAHAERSQVYLCRQGEAMPVTITTLGAAIRAASFVPPLTVLNMCEGYELAHRLYADGHTVISWPGTVNDSQCRLFATQLYRVLARGERLASAFGTAEMMLVASNIGILPPILTGDGTARFRHRGGG
ncbi:MAG TPA: hypothetical protein VFM54_17105 [Micromonosporaceae bacterium]|nr:hypothetical protein [Micromonosporaceae bacterium]